MSAAYRNRAEAGRELAAKLSTYKERKDLLILALPRGGVPVAYQVARALRAPLDVFLVRKLGVPGHEELAMGAIANNNTLVINGEIAQIFGISDSELKESIKKEYAELVRCDRLYRGRRPEPLVQGRTVIVVDDGLATGSTMQAAVAALKQQLPARIVIAVPVAAPETCAAFQGTVDDIVCARTPELFYEVDEWYEDFSQVTEQEVRQLLSLAATSLPPQPLSTCAAARV